MCKLTASTVGVYCSCVCDLSQSQILYHLNDPFQNGLKLDRCVCSVLNKVLPSCA